MYESYTRQALPERKYRELLGSALCVFNANSAFIVENILRCDINNQYSWYALMDLEAGHLKKSIREIISTNGGNEIEALFSRIIMMRNRIIHSFQITREGKQILATKEREKDGGAQFVISEEYLLNFIKENEKLSLALHTFRGY